jgi:hypothetical protein
MTLQLDPPVWLETPKGPAYAYLVIDYGMDYHLLWVCFLKETGECWTFPNPEVRLATNPTMDVRCSPTPSAR